MPDQQQRPEETVSLKDFFEKIPPGREVSVEKLVTRQYLQSATAASFVYDLPLIELHCDTDSCNGIRLFGPTRDLVQGTKEEIRDCFVNFRCRNCGRTFKTYALQTYIAADGLGGRLLKLGERPPFGPPAPARVVTLIGPDKEYYFKGRRCESQGLGIGAFAYYRR